MAVSTVWSVHNARRQHVASCVHVEDAAALVALHGEGATIRFQGGRALWREGAESQSAAESYDYVAEVVRRRYQENAVAAFDRLHRRPAVAAGVIDAD